MSTNVKDCPIVVPLEVVLEELEVLTFEEFEASLPPLAEMNGEDTLNDASYFLANKSEIRSLIRFFKYEVSDLNKFMADEEFKNSCQHLGINEGDIFKDGDDDSVLNLCYCEAHLIIKYCYHLISELQDALGT